MRKAEDVGVSPATGQQKMDKYGFENKKRKSDILSLTAEEKKDIDKALDKFVVGALMPISVVDKESFKDFVSALNPKYTVPCAKTVSGSLKSQFEKEKEELKKELKKADFVAVTHDSWTSIATVSYETVTVHYIDDSLGKWELMSKVLDTSAVGGSHSAEAIAGFLSGVKTRWQLPEILAVSDNASVEVKTFNLLGWPRIGCFGHLLNLIVRKFLEQSRTRNIIARCRNLVTFFHKSPQATTEYKKKQILLMNANQMHAPIHDVATTVE